MKKLVIVLVLFILVGCSSSSNEYIYDQDADLGETQERIEEVLPEPEEEKPILYDPLPEWANVTMSDCALQVDNLFFGSSMTVEEFLNTLSSSENDYECSINESGLLSNEEIKDYSVKRRINGALYDWLNIRVKCPYKDTVPVLKGIVFKVAPTEESWPFCRILDGRSYDEFASMNYNEIIEFMNECQEKNSEFVWNESEYWGNKNILDIEFAGSKNQTKEIKIEEADIVLSLTRYYSLYINKSDGSVRKFEMPSFIY